ncbi:FAD:protein FMN transferase [Frigoriglobus tundricola]|uniref:FAD:protein FMN transferase n=2 Tax=Frigoriglobus tundricola TaxID=2774151 RepID=A0A6M5Z648_9BACT|nr:FAD:protein FMN transferase [Frigoriglobus tundricola]
MTCYSLLLAGFCHLTLTGALSRPAPLNGTRSAERGARNEEREPEGTFGLPRRVPHPALRAPSEGRGVGSSRFEFESKHMGTTFRITFYAADRPTAKKAADAAFVRIAELDGIMSDYKKESELMRLCRAFASEVAAPVKVSDDLFFVLQKAEALSIKSDGAFDVTVGPVVQLWRLARRTQELPDPKEFARARERVGYKMVKLDPQKKTVQLLTPGMQLDLGGIAKGYAADEALKLLRDTFGIKRALVAASGDILCGEPPPGTDGWKVEIAPIAKSQKPRTLTLANAAVSTSGDLEQFVEIKGVRYSHVLDPKTGLGLTGRRSVTVIAPDGITADSMTKAASVLPRERALELIEGTPGAAAYIVILDNDEKPVTTSSKRFPKE